MSGIHSRLSIYVSAASPLPCSKKTARFSDCHPTRLSISGLTKIFNPVAEIHFSHGFNLSPLHPFRASRERQEAIKMQEMFKLSAAISNDQKHCLTEDPQSADLASLR